MQASMILGWLLVGLLLAPAVGPAAAMPQDATTSDVADVQASEEIESGVESPVSNPEVGEAPVLDESRFLLGDWGSWRSAWAAEGISFDATLDFRLGERQDDESPIDFDEDGDVDEGDLARAAQNPVADLISLPFQNNLNTDVGQFNNAQNVLNIQPVIPFNLNEDWNLITRTIFPLVYQPSLFPGDDYDFGLGDVQFSAFFAPVEPVNGWILGAGPTVRLPTATNRRLGPRKWAAGPSVVALRMEGPWVFGGLVQNVWSLAGSGDRNFSEFLIQPFVNYNLSDGWYLTSSPIITANWYADSDNQWTVPVGGGVGKILQTGAQPMNLSVQGYYNVETPTNGPEWTIRIQLQLLFPK